MPNQLTLEVGAGSVSIPLKGTAAQIRAAVRRYVVNSGLSVTGKTEAEIGRMALQLVAEHVKERSSQQHAAELLEVQKSTIAAQVAVDNDLVDPLPTV